MGLPRYVFERLCLDRPVTRDRQHVPPYAHRAGLLHAAQEAACSPRAGQDGVTTLRYYHCIQRHHRALREFMAVAFFIFTGGCFAKSGLFYMQKKRCKTWRISAPGVSGSAFPFMALLGYPIHLTVGSSQH